MELEIYQIDAFTSEVFRGNPACVVPLSKWLNDEVMLKIANENNVPETAFLIKKNNDFCLRWFTPNVEMDLCGHATLATAHYLKQHQNHPNDEISFHTKSGILKSKFINGSIQLELPLREPKKTIIPPNLDNAVNYKPIEVLRARDFILVYDNQFKIENLELDNFFQNKLCIYTGKYL